MSIKSIIKKSIFFQFYAFFTVKESVDSLFANRLGVTLFRVVLSEFSRKIQSLFYINKRANASYQELVENGYTLINNFFSNQQLEKLKTTINNDLLKLEDSHSQDGAQYIVKNIEYFKIFSQSEFFHAVKKPNDSVEDKLDINLLMHSDTFHKTLKGFLYLEPLTIEDGPFEYIKSSNKLNKKRLLREYKNSSNELILRRDHGGWRFEDDFYKHNESIKFTGIANTMIVADTFGLHRRNPRSNQGFRVSIHFSLRKSPFSLSGKITG
ncbi:MAG: hypothetical protein B7Y37_14215 [Sphingobacteriia bacterium 28-36-52]|nr:MAG: hypothetical protein B7Y37_14215 [Sphingobacteriia bacterium 28-36-52]